MTLAILFLSFFAFLVIGAPIGVSLGSSAVLACWWASAIPLPILGQKLYSNLDSFLLTAVPFFFVAAALMETGGIVRYLVNFANMIVGRARGGLGMTGVLACMFFAAISGSSPATVAAVGGIMIPTLIEKGYPRSYAIGVVTVAGGLGIMFPPSIPLILYGFVTETSIPKLFMAGIVPGVLYALLLMAMAWFKARKFEVPPPPKITRPERVHSILMSLPALCLPMFLLIGIYGFPTFTIGSLHFHGGAMFTPTEAALMCCFGALLVGAFVYRETTPSTLYKTVIEVMPRIGMIFWIVTNAVLFGFFMAQQGVPTMLAEWLVAQHMSPGLFLVMVNIILIIAGIFLDGVPMILMFMPVLFPAAKSLGIDPIHLAIVVVLNIELGLIHPPVGMNLYVASTISKASLLEVTKAVLPWMCITFFMLILVTYVPIISTFLPSLMSD